MMNLDKKFKILGFTISALPVIIIGASLTAVCAAYSVLTCFTETPVVNRFTFFQPAELFIEIDEGAADPNDVAWGTDTKPVAIYNSSGANGGIAAVRAMLVPTLYDASGNAAEADFGDITAGPELGAAAWALGDLTVHMAEDWELYWEFTGGYFYYTGTLLPGNTTEDLFAGVTLDRANAQNYAGKNFVVEILADGIDDSYQW